MFEKSLYDLIRGLRNHKGSEKEYIQNSLKECRNEIRQADMDVKATALLKLIYLEMFGHDMSWASFHVLEVMSSAKYLQKRVGYLGAEQSFRPDTDVLMLATNLLKKDLSSTSINTMSLPIATLPHVITSSLAMSVLSDLLPRLNHSNPAVRKKTIVTLYRLALVYPETLRPSWPKIKERLMDEREDSSVTAAIVNVVCELGWRRPQDFLPMAPRLFDLLVDSGNNWMAIKLIKLFATLTPLEPRLVRKLLPPLTSIIRTTPAMSLLYECIDGIIQGGILDSADGEEIASLCVSKLRGMIMVEGDANLKYVALLAFGKIVKTHPFLVAQQEDVILDCLDSADITIRMRALDLVVGMVSPDNLVSIVSRLMRQLRSSPRPGPEKLPHLSGVEPAAESDDEAPEVTIKSAQQDPSQSLVLPDEYRIEIINKILEMCSSNNYGNLVDFDWYIDVLTQLVRNAPAPNPALSAVDASESISSAAFDVSENIGNELRSVAVKVKAVRAVATRAAEGILTASYSEVRSQSGAGRGALRPSAWVAGEYAVYLASPDDVLTALLQLCKPHTSSESLAIYLQAIPKILALLAGDDHAGWSPGRKSMMTLLMARILHALEPLAIHPDLEVQERTVEFLELLKLTSEATSAQEASADDADTDAPLLLTQALPSLFRGFELNSVAPGAQRNVPLPPGLDLDQPINIRLNELLSQADSFDFVETEQDEFEIYYHQKPASIPAVSLNEPAAARLSEKEEFVSSYQQSGEESYLDPDIVARRKAERMERYKDDPFYIGEGSGTSTPLHNIIQSNNGPDLDIDSIPIMQLDIGKTTSPAPGPKPRQVAVPRQRIQVSADETLPGSGSITPREDSEGDSRSKAGKVKSLLQVDSSGLSAFSFDDQQNEQKNAYDYEAQQREEAEMAQAMKEVERLRLEMQRANERIQTAQGVDTTVVKKKKKKKAVEGEPVKSKKKKAKTLALEEEDTPSIEADPSVTATVVKTKKKKKKKVVEEVPITEAQEA